MKYFLTLGLAALSLAAQAFGVSYLSDTPLSSLVTTKATACSAMPEVRVPLITWGGDIATLYANGNDVKTTEGSLFGKQGLKLQLVREDHFAKQLEGFLSCKSPYLRGTLGMIHMASGIAAKDPRSKLTVIYQMTWSAGGDALVVKDSIKKPLDLKGKTIALQAYGPHVDYLGKILTDAGVPLSEVKIKWVKDLTGSGEAPPAAFRTPEVDAAFVITPDALALTSNGSVGTGAEDSVKGARILLSTKSANKIIADVYAVRQDYLDAHRDDVRKFVHGLMLGQEELAALFKNKEAQKDPYSKTLKSAAKVLLDSDQALADTEGLYSDASFVGWAGNRQFFTDPSYPRSFSRLNEEIAASLLSLKLIDKASAPEGAPWDFEQLKGGIALTQLNQAGKFDAAKVASVVAQKNSQGTLGDDSLFAFEVFFEPNQNGFSPDKYAADFKRVIALASTYGGAIITIEGHSDPLGYLKQQKAGADNVVLQKVRQAAKNLSLTRANSVRDALITYAKASGISLDPTQFAVIGHGIARPRSGLCGVDPCAPQNKEQWLQNMRVEFKLIKVEAEEAVFSPI